ncbi:hypothetical protein HT031_005148 [Scenedesmus sp. PABB004]|nr:hypothetical protein HT031_005148 [Scenedesmus sp. PABB004]
MKVQLLAPCPRIPGWAPIKLEPGVPPPPHPGVAAAAAAAFDATAALGRAGWTPPAELPASPRPPPAAAAAPAMQQGGKKRRAVGGEAVAEVLPHDAPGAAGMNLARQLVRADAAYRVSRWFDSQPLTGGIVKEPGGGAWRVPMRQATDLVMAAPVLRGAQLTYAPGRRVAGATPACCHGVIESGDLESEGNPEAYSIRHARRRGGAAARRRSPAACVGCGLSGLSRHGFEVHLGSRLKNAPAQLSVDALGMSLQARAGAAGRPGRQLQRRAPGARGRQPDLVTQVGAVDLSLAACVYCRTEDKSDGTLQTCRSCPVAYHAGCLARAAPRAARPRSLDDADTCASCADAGACAAHGCAWCAAHAPAPPDLDALWAARRAELDAEVVGAAGGLGGDGADAGGNGALAAAPAAASATAAAGAGAAAAPAPSARRWQRRAGGAADAAGAGAGAAGRARLGASRQLTAQLGDGWWHQQLAGEVLCEPQQAARRQRRQERQLLPDLPTGGSDSEASSGEDDGGLEADQLEGEALAPPWAAAAAEAAAAAHSAATGGAASGVGAGEPDQARRHDGVLQRAPASSGGAPRRASHVPATPAAAGTPWHGAPAACSAPSSAPSAAGAAAAVPPGAPPRPGSSAESDVDVPQLPLLDTRDQGSVLDTAAAVTRLLQRLVTERVLDGGREVAIMRAVRECFRQLRTGAPGAAAAGPGGGDAQADQARLIECVLTLGAVRAILRERGAGWAAAAAVELEQLLPA